MNESMDKLAAPKIASKAMMTQSILPLCVMLASSVSVLGCIATEGNDADTEALGTTQEAALSNNALSNNALSNNALSNNALSNNALSNNALSNNALSNNAILVAALTDPNARELLKYIVSCALPPTSTVDFTSEGVNYSYPGELGLTPKWGLPGGTCNEACQRWISACVMARVDFLGEKVSISLRGPHANLATTPAERAQYTVREGVYYGNIFRDPADQERYACVAPGRHGLPRVCGPTLDGCFLHATGWCNDTCGGTLPDGSYLDCHDTMRVNNQYPADSENFPTSITVFLKP